jgi:hypothetical protein
MTISVVMRVAALACFMVAALWDVERSKLQSVGLALWIGSTFA